MKNKDLFRLRAGLQNAGKYKGAKFAYAVAKNIRLVNDEIAAIEETQKPSDEIQEFEKRRLVLCVKYSEIENGDAKLVNGRYQIKPENQKDFAKELNELRVEYKDALDALEKQNADFQTFLEQSYAGPDLHKVSVEFLPDIDGDTLASIMEMITE